MGIVDRIMNPYKFEWGDTKPNWGPPSEGKTKLATKIQIGDKICSGVYGDTDVSEVIDARSHYKHMIITTRSVKGGPLMEVRLRKAERVYVA
jgi:hypothetical protein